MKTNSLGRPHELFESVNQQGVRWAFVIFPSDRWTITRRGKQVARGTSDSASVLEGVKQFMSLTNPVSGATPLDSAVAQRLDQIELGDRSSRSNGDGRVVAPRAASPSQARAPRKPRESRMSC